MQDVKSFFHSWCNKQGKFPYFEVKPSDPEQGYRFECELRVEGYPYIGYGNSNTKKSAQFNAARDFVQYLVRERLISPSDTPADLFAKDGENSKQCRSQSSKPGENKSQIKPDLMGVACCPFKEGKINSTYTHIDQITDHKNVQHAEQVDMNPAIHGNYTMENGKSKLHQFLQRNNIKADYKYTQTGFEHCKSFVAEMTIHIKKLNRTLSGRESASNKATASKSCALSLVRQLYHLGVIDAFDSIKKDKDSEIKPYPVTVSPELENRINDVLKTLKITPAPVPECGTPEQGVSIISSAVLDEFISKKKAPAGVVSWSPPMENWNAWTEYKLDEGRLAEMKLDEISEFLEKTQKNRIEKDEKYRKIMGERWKMPVYGSKKEILETVKENPVTIIRGSTGCGKTTQVCQFILDDHIHTGRGAYCNIIVTQPRRISAISLSERVAFERSETPGNSVGYSVRFESCLPRPFGGILFCTVGVLLKKLENGLKGVSHVIVDEIHERDVNTDFILVVLRDMVNTYPDLTVILMSATIDTTLFCDYFGKCPIVEIPGQTHAVREFFLEDCIELLDFQPPFYPSRKRKVKERSKNDDDDEEDEDEDNEFQTSQVEDDGENCNAIVADSYKPETKQAMKRMNERETSFALIEALLKHVKHLGQPGAVLIFLPGWNLILSLMRHLQTHSYFGNPSFVILPLHSQLPREDQRKVFDVYPESVTKVILATNIAESSITINDVVYVIDSCKARMKIYTSHNNLTNYSTVWAAKSNLEQRKGRAGRVRPGMCFRLCSRARYNKLDEYMTPEMLRTPLHELALTVKLLRLGSVGQFLSRAVEPPPIDAIFEAELLLRELKCLDSNDEITPLGRILGRMPIEPRLGKMMVLGCLFNCADPLVTVAANSSTFSEVFIQPFGKRRLTFKQKSLSGIRHSDHVAILNAFYSWNEKRALGLKAEETFCDSKMLSMPTLRLTSEAKKQLVYLMTGVFGFPKETMAAQNFNYVGPDPKLDLVIALLCMGLYPNVAYHQSRRKLLTPGHRIALIHKSSVNCSNFDQTFPIPFFIYGEKIRTRAISCKMTTMVTPIHLLLFGARKVDFVKGVIKLDDWLLLEMKPELASAIVALRPALEGLIIKASKDPKSITRLSDTDQKVIDVIKELCKFNAGKYVAETVESKGLGRRELESFEEFKGPPLKKARFWNSSIGGPKSFSKRGFRSGWGEFKSEHFSSNKW